MQGLRPAWDADFTEGVRPTDVAEQVLKVDM